MYLFLNIISSIIIIITILFIVYLRLLILTIILSLSFIDYYHFYIIFRFFISLANAFFSCNFFPLTHNYLIVVHSSFGHQNQLVILIVQLKRDQFFVISELKNFSGYFRVSPISVNNLSKAWNMEPVCFLIRKMLSQRVDSSSIIWHISNVSMTKEYLEKQRI